MNPQQESTVFNTDFLVPPECQGQAVTYAYGVDGEAVENGRKDYIIRRRTAPGEPTLYERFADPQFEHESSSNLEFWNTEPVLGEKTEEWNGD